MYIRRAQRAGVQLGWRVNGDAALPRVFLNPLVVPSIDDSPRTVRQRDQTERHTFLARAEEFVVTRAHDLTGEPATPLMIEVRGVSSALVVDLQYPSRVHRVVVKSTAANSGLRVPSQLAGVLTAVREGLHPALQESLPNVLGFDDSSQLIALSFVEGRDFSSELWQVSSRREQSHDIVDLLRRASAVLSLLHQCDAQERIPNVEVRTHDSFVASFEEGPQSPSFRRAWTRTHLLDRLSPTFFARRADRVFFHDAGPKNLIVRPSGDLCMIDLDCSAGPPALGVAWFLVGLDRDGCGRPHREARIAAWKRVFVEAYAQRASREFGEDLTFFYPWALSHMIDDHSRRRPWAAAYLNWYYTQQLKKFLRALGRFSPGQMADNPSSAFSES